MFEKIVPVEYVGCPSQLKLYRKLNCWSIFAHRVSPACLADDISECVIVTIDSAGQSGTCDYVNFVPPRQESLKW